MGELLGVDDLRREITKRRIALALGALALAGTAGGGYLFVRYAARAAPDPQRVVVAPFDVFAPGRERWRVELAMALTDALGRSGRLSAVPQAVVAERWRAKPTPAIAAVELARRTGAGLAVFGRLDAAGGDSIAAQVAVADAVAARLLFQVTLRGAPAGPRELADSLAARIVPRLP